MTAVETQHGRPLSTGERRTIALLGLPTFALALAVTVAATYLPVVARAFVGSTVAIGVIVGLEGVVALWLPQLVGGWSDQLRTPIGGRLPFVVAATPVVVTALIWMALVSTTLTLAGAALMFFVGYFIAYEPYRALYPDAVAEVSRAQAAWPSSRSGRQIHASAAAPARRTSKRSL